MHGRGLSPLCLPKPRCLVHSSSLGLITPNLGFLANSALTLMGQALSRPFWIEFIRLLCSRQLWLIASGHRTQASQLLV